MTRRKAVRIAIMVLAFIIGYMACWTLLMRPMNDEQFAMCEQVAKDVYNQSGQTIIEAPEDVYVNVTSTTITVGLQSVTYRGEVIAKLQNGELVLTRNMQTARAVFLSILIGIICFLISVIIILSIKETKYQKSLPRKYMH